MRAPERGEKGFTLIELLIVVVIVGVLAAVVIPNVGRFLGRGEEEARKDERHNIQIAMISLMIENKLSAIPNPIDYASGTASNDMTAIPDITSICGSADKALDPIGDVYGVGDKNGYMLYGCDITADAAASPTWNYVTRTTTKYYYACEWDGTIRQWSDAAMSTEYVD